MIELTDSNSLEQTNELYEETTSKFNSFFDKAKKLKSLIEYSIDDLNRSIKRTFRKINKEFRSQHSFLSRTRYSLKNELNEKIDNIKEELNNFLKRTENIISSFGKISKLIDNFGDEYESHIIRTWCYISEINKYNEKANDLFEEPKKTLFFTFDDEELKVNYSNYYFDGLPVPENIRVEENEDNKIEVTWENNEDKIKDYSDKNKIEYEIEIKNAFKKYEFKSKEKKLILDKLDKYKLNKIHIRTVLNKSYSTWSKIEEFEVEYLPKKEKAINTLFAYA